MCGGFNGRLGLVCELARRVVNGVSGDHSKYHSTIRKMCEEKKKCWNSKELRSIEVLLTSDCILGLLTGCCFGAADVACSAGSAAGLQVSRASADALHIPGSNHIQQSIWLEILMDPHP